RSYAETTAVQRVIPSLPAGGEVRTLSAEAQAGDGTLLLNAFLDVAGIEVSDPAANRVEYHDLGALSGADGFYRFDGAGPVRTLDLSASAAGFQPLLASWTISYGEPVNVVNFRLRP